MPRTNFQDLLDAGSHFGHLKRKWNPKMAPYIFMEKNGIHIIDLHKTVVKIDEAANMMKQLARALCAINAEYRPALKAAGFLTRDSREVERKKPGQPGARRRFQFSKR